MERYDLSFIKEYAEIYGISNKELAAKFHCGIKIVDKILNGELKVKAGPLEEIIYEFGYDNYENFKNGIIKKTNDRRKLEQEQSMYSPIRFDFNKMNNIDRIIISMICDHKKITDRHLSFLNVDSINVEDIIKRNILSYKREPLENEEITIKEGANYNTPINKIYDYNLMNNKDRIIISLLTDDNILYSPKQTADFTNCDENHIKEVYRTVINDINYVSTLDVGFQKTKA